MTGFFCPMLIGTCISLCALGSFSSGAGAQDEVKRFIGRSDLQAILDYDQRYADGAFIYIPDAEALAVFQAVNKPVTIKLFYRTDCSDSVREVPRFIKTIQVANNTLISVDAIGINREKNQPADLLKGWNIELVPTFIVVVDGAEIGRVVEVPQDKIEIDLAGILKQIS